MPKINDSVLIGEKDLQKLFKKLPGKVQRKLLRPALSAGATPVVKEAKKNAAESKESGTLQKSIDKKIVVYKSGGGVAIVGPKKDAIGEYKGKVRIPRHYAHLVEGGHIDENGNPVPAKPFLRPAFESKKQEAIGKMRDRLAVGIVKEATK